MAHLKVALQSYNFGPGYISWVKTNYNGVYSAENAKIFSEMMAEKNGWQRYGDPEYVPHVMQYYQITYSSGGWDLGSIGDSAIAATLNELAALWPSMDSRRSDVIVKGASLAGKITYSMQGDRASSSDEPTTKDCSSFVAWAFQKAGCTDVPYYSCTGTFLASKSFEEITYEELKPGDIGLKNRVESGGENHVGIYAGKMPDGTDRWLHCTSWNGGSGVALNNYGNFTIYCRYTGFTD